MTLIPVGKYRLFQSKAVNKSSKEPALAIGVTTGTVAGILTLIGIIFPDSLSAHTTQIILVISALVLPIITALFTRGKVWSPASVQEVIDAAVQEALQIAKRRNASKRID